MNSAPGRQRHTKDERPVESSRPQRRKKGGKGKRLQDMDAAVQRLRVETQMLEDRRRTLSSTVNTRESHVAMICEFFRLFRYGMQPHTPALVQAEQPPAVETQLGFVDARFHRNVRSADGFGIPTFLNQLRSFSFVHDDVRIELLRCVEVISMESSTVIRFLKRFTLTITDTTIQYVFPHLLHPEHRGIVSKMVGQQFYFLSNGSFVVDESAAVTEAEWTVDFVTGMLGVLSLEDVAVVLQQAQIAEDAYLTTNIPPTEAEDRARSISPARHTQSPASETSVALPRLSIDVGKKKREQWRRNQSRYRKERMMTIGNLEVDVARLRMEILHIEAQRHTLHESVNTHESTVGVVVDLFRRLRDGVSSGAVTEPECPATQLELASSRSARCLSSARGSGFRSFVDQMQRFLVLKDDVAIELLRCVEISTTETSKIVEVVQRVHLVVSETSLSHVFPHLFKPELHRIKDKLLGQQLSFLVGAFFVFDETGAVVDVHWSIDFVAGLQGVLTLEEIAAVIQPTRIGEGV